jgi:hypothetical protein
MEFDSNLFDLLPNLRFGQLRSWLVSHVRSGSVWVIEPGGAWISLPNLCDKFNSYWVPVEFWTWLRHAKIVIDPNPKDIMRNKTEKLPFPVQRYLTV